MSTTPQLPKTLNQYYEIAQHVMSQDDQAYFLGGAGDEKTVGRNEAAFDSATLVPRHLRSVAGGSTATSLLGETHASPILVAPFAYHRLLDPAGETATAQGSEAQAVKMVLSAQSSVDLHSLRSPHCDWFQLYWLGSREATLALATRALDAGYTILVLTIDAPVQGVRDREIEEGFQLPPDVSAVNLTGLPQPRFEPLRDNESVIFDRIAHVTADWEDVAWLCAAVAAPVVLKGVLHPDDAGLAVQTGAAGIIVSNHGGRVLDGAPATLEMLPAVVAKVGPDYPILMDGGIRRGADVLTALALGAKAVLVGRPVVCGLAVGGALGVSHVLRLLRDELEIAMLLVGCRTIDDITPDSVHLKR